MIFENVHAARARAAGEPDTLRISPGTKAKVKVGDFSRGGSARGLQAVRALDHDMSPQAILVPFGILELSRGATPIHQPWLTFGQSRETADFMADGIEQWWEERQTLHRGVRRLHIELDNGPETSSSRTQFMKRLVEFADGCQLEIELVYLPPYHSKYNPIERFWGVLEQHWNGVLLSSIPAVLQWARSAAWHGVHPIAGELRSTYQRGVTLTRAEFRPFSNRLVRSEKLCKWSLTITPA